MTTDRSLRARDGFQIRVFGEPLPQPKTVPANRRLRGGKVIPFVMKQDYLKRKDPVTGKEYRAEQGRAAMWVRVIQQTCLAYMHKNGLMPFPKGHPIALGLRFYLTKPRGCKLPKPSIAPDDSNLAYLVENALKRSPAHRDKFTKRLLPGPFPDGILYYDDDQITDRALPDGEQWADELNPPGVLITVIDARADRMVYAMPRDIERIREEVIYA